MLERFLIYAICDLILRLQGWKGILLASLFVLAISSGCSTRSPVAPGMSMSITKIASVSHGEKLKEGLKVHWFGTSCFALQFGDNLILTDPFFTHQPLSRTLLRRPLHSDHCLVDAKLKTLPRAPDAIFVGHSHFDHILDAPAVLNKFSATPIYGSDSVRNVICGSGSHLTNRWKNVVVTNEWQNVTPGIRYKAIPTTHARQIKFLPLFYGGDVCGCREGSGAGAYKVGENYAYAFEFVSKTTTNVVYFAGSAHHGCEGLFSESIPQVDVAILPVASWKNADSYPSTLIKRLKPKHIIASHFNSFYQVDGKAPRMFPTIDMTGFLLQAQEAARSYSNFVSIEIPSVDSSLLLNSD